MNDKQLAQIEEWLADQKRYKLLDRERTGLLRLKGSLLQVWLAQYMNEGDDQESWLSIATLMELTDLSENTVITARKKLSEGGWIRAHAGKTAAQKYEKPTRGAHKVSVYSVDDPSAKSAGAKIAGADIAPANVIPPKIATMQLLCSSLRSERTKTKNQHQHPLPVRPPRPRRKGREQ
jgi:hypothetical protein